ncbi:aminotransferase class I/II-fold pyridoxal phosphate-dependent enzyme [Eubacterium callanderi]|uniref:aminotransferase class I/II-fold pyridoxal phosphate-dependent enzyme n=1 Tax=Eubacterium callanderi TaxID=53442 RepID=UPI0011DD4720|nr:aminotransferase class I/II-fold pyridoxal phosphate-dependent enzyme [Eubacterium callanderi]MBV1681866.1 aminotransferase class I/II-fold pyridoxal phosphate-dependent enzyme [Eubacterium callanderi]WPK76456.1 Histidinol-phosphate aminotransferase [Eubacterium callanderi]
MQAIILAAGMGKRLKELTDGNTKCMVKVNGLSMIERMLSQLDRLNLERIVLVVGYRGQQLIDYIQTLTVKTRIEYVNNEIYDKTNNIYSLYMAKEYLLEDDTLLLESDLIFEDALLEKIVKDPYPSLALVAKYESWMDGTVVTLGEDRSIKQFLGKKEFVFEDIPKYYKTVNIYKFSQSFSETHYVPFLEAYCKALGHNEYYEQVLKVITLLERPEIKALPLENEIWYEIDDIQDLDIAESIFATEEDHLQKFQKRFGGYWRYPHMLDFCYLVNPFFPNQKLLDEIKANFDRLISEYPSGMEVNSLLAAKYFGLHKDQICIGNGAAELIKSLMGMIDGKLGIVMPTFEEYPNRRNEKDLEIFIPDNQNFSYGVNDLKKYFDTKNISALSIINPDNPSGNYIPKDDLIRLIQWGKRKNIKIIIDESFVDFAGEENSSLLDETVIEKYSNLIVIKSISKSFGVPGLRLGVLATSDYTIIEKIKKEVSIWNINSFAEFYMQICEKYKNDYQEGLRNFRETRKKFLDALVKIKGVRIVPTQANFVLCELTSGVHSIELSKQLLVQKNILIKDISSKKGLNGGQYIRLAIRNDEDNRVLLMALNELINN